VELIRSSGGAFEVIIDGELIFSKRATGHFPNEDRLVEDIRQGRV